MVSTIFMVLSFFCLGVTLWHIYENWRLRRVGADEKLRLRVMKRGWVWVAASWVFFGIQMVAR